MEQKNKLKEYDSSTKTNIESSKKEFNLEKILSDIETEYNRLISLPVENYQKYINLKDIGFTSAPQVIEANTFMIDRTEAIQYFERKKYYKYTYNLQYITKNKVNFICKEFDFVHQPSTMFTGKIPTEKIDEILSINLKSQDEKYFKMTSAYVFLKTFIDIQEFNKIKKTKKEDGYYYPTRKKSRDVYGIEKQYSVIAPKESFEGSNINNDPIILYPVKDGYLIVSHW